MTKVLVTGANGFVGRETMRALQAGGYSCVAAVRRQPIPPFPPGTELVEVGDIGPETDWTRAVQGVEFVMHVAGRAHVVREHARDPLSDYRRINVIGTKRLAQAAIAASVRRFVFVSSVKVNGEVTGCQPFTGNDTPAPVDAYGISKWEAEQELRRLAAASNMEIAIVRPVLVYGPGVRANFLSLFHLVYKGLPLPFGMVDNRRSMVSLGNLASLLARCLWHPGAAGRTFMASDGEDLSTPDWIRRIASALHKSARLLPLPPQFIRLASICAGKPGLANRLCGSLVVDSKPAREALEWEPPFSVDQELARTARWYLQTGVAKS